MKLKVFNSFFFPYVDSFISLFLYVDFNLKIIYIFCCLNLQSKTYTNFFF